MLEVTILVLAFLSGLLTYRMARAQIARREAEARQKAEKGAPAAERRKLDS